MPTNQNMGGMEPVFLAVIVVGLIGVVACRYYQRRRRQWRNWSRHVDQVGRRSHGADV